MSDAGRGIKRFDTKRNLDYFRLAVDSLQGAKLKVGALFQNARWDKDQKSRF